MAGAAADARPPHRVLRATSGTVALIVAGVAAVLLLGDALLRAGIVEMLRLAPWVLLVVWGVYVLMYASHIAFDAREVTVQNYLRVTRTPWLRVEDISLRWQVVLALHDGGTVTAYGGPVVGRPGRAARRERRADERAGAGSTDDGRSLPAALREVAELRDAWQQAERDPGAPEPTRRWWDLPALAALVVILIGAAASTLSTVGS